MSPLPATSTTSPVLARPEADPIVRVVGLGRRLGGAWALRRVDFEVQRGRSMIFFGANGAGKTTLLRVLGTALRPTVGTVTLFGGSPWDARSRTSLLSHADHHYDELTARENLRLAVTLGPRPLSADGVDAVLAEVGLTGRADEPVRGFSAGMRKRLAFARLLVKGAELVLLDEPYAQLDPAGHAFVDRLIRRLRAGGSTVLVSTHQVTRVAALVEDGLLLDHGRVAWVGPAADAPARLPAIREEDT